MEEVRSVLGASRKTRNVIHGTEMWNYGEKWLVFEQGVVIGILTNESSAYSGKGCNANQLPIRTTTCGGKTCFPDRDAVVDSEESVLEAEISRPWRLKFSRVLWSADQRVRKGIKPFLKRLVVSNGFPTFLFVSGS